MVPNSDFKGLGEETNGFFGIGWSGGLEKRSENECDRYDRLLRWFVISQSVFGKFIWFRLPIPMSQWRPDVISKRLGCRMIVFISLIFCFLSFFRATVRVARRALRRGERFWLKRVAELAWWNICRALSGQGFSDGGAAWPCYYTLCVQYLYIPCVHISLWQQYSTLT